MYSDTEEEYFDQIQERPKIKSKFGLTEEDFVEVVKFHTCLFEKSQTPIMKIKKQEALQAIKAKIRQDHGVDLKISQIRKKIENMKGRVKTKGDKNKTGNFHIALKPHEMQILHLMDYKNNPRKIPGAEECGVQNSIRDSIEVVDVDILLKEEKQLPRPSGSTSLLQLVQTASQPKDKERNYITSVSVLKLQTEVLEQQKELNKQQQLINQQQIELNIQEKELLQMQKEKTLLQIDSLKNK